MKMLIVCSVTFMYLLFISGTVISNVSNEEDIVIHADNLLNEGKVYEAEKAIIEKLRNWENNDCALYVMAKININKNAITYRTLAEKFILKAIDLRPEKRIYHLLLVEIYKRQGFSENARRYLEKLLEPFPNDPDILYQLAEIYKKNSEQLQYQISAPNIALYDNNYFEQLRLHHQGVEVKKLIEYVGQRYQFEGHGQLIEYSKYYGEELRKAKRLYEEVYRIDPRFKELVYKRALLAYLEKDWDLMISICSEAINGKWDNRNILLAAGLAYLRKGDYEKSGQYFNKFREKLLPYEVEKFDAIAPFLINDEEIIYEKMNSMEKELFTRKYWYSKDPLFLTDQNERLLEHWGRIAETELLFGIPMKNIDGWDTDRGIIWIRYGPPMKQIMNKNIIADDISLGKKLGDNDPLFTHDITLFWYYEKFTFMFYEFPNGSSQFKLFEDSNYSNRLFAEYLQKQTPEIFDLNIRGKRYDFPRYAIGFRGNEGKVRMELFYGIPVRALEYFKRPGERYVANVEEGVFLFDMNLRQVIRNVKSERFLSPASFDSSKDRCISRLNRMELNPGLYNVAIEFKDDSSGNYGAIRDQIYLKCYRSDSLEVSDILIASSIELPKNGQVNSIDDLSYSVNVTRSFRKPKPIYLYFEVYNLSPTLPSGMSKFRVEYSIRQRGNDVKDVWSVKKVLAKMFRMAGRKYEIADEHEYEGTDSVENLILEIDTESLEKGMYQLAVSIKDIQAGSSAESKTEFYVID